uniref:Uncharacterized protein n=2 Tax=Anguilla anguilla TaxID=7936 RepID=A0A0E9T428_ANGAN
MCGLSYVFAVGGCNRSSVDIMSIPVFASGFEKIHVLFGLFGYFVAVFNCHVDNGLVYKREPMIITLSLSGDQQRSRDEQQDQW